MSPESVEGRLGRLEREVATLQQQAKDVVHDIEVFAPMAASVVRVEVGLEQVKLDLAGLRSAIAEDRAAAQARGHEMASEIKAMRDEQSAQARANRAQVISAAGAIIAALLIAVGTIIAAGGIG